MYKKITIGAFILSLILFFSLVFLFPRDENASIKENRPLAEMPEITWQSIFSGEFMGKYEEYLSDNVGFRSVFTDLGTRFERLRGITLPATGQVLTLPSGSQLAIYDGKIMEIFKANADAKAAYINVINSYAELLPNGTDMYLMLVPTQIEFDKSSYASLADSQRDAIDEVYGALSGVVGVNVYDVLAEHTDEYLYFRTDHHWTQRGAYYGYTAIMDELGEAAIPLEEMENGKVSGFLGYLYNQANLPDFAKYADDIEYFIPGENYKVEASLMEDGKLIEYASSIYAIPSEGQTPLYSIFMGGDHAFAKVTTNNKNGKCALVIKDSYANALTPFLTSHYETVLIIDPRNFYGTLTELFNEYDVDDVFVINYALSTTLTGFISFLEGIK